MLFLQKADQFIKEPPGGSKVSEVFCLRFQFVFLWRLQVKELGAMVYNCSCLAEDLGKIFEAYWFLGASQSIPSPWPPSFSTQFNKDTPLQLALNDTPSSVYLSVRSGRRDVWDGSSAPLWPSVPPQSSPPSFCAAGRTPDLQSILSVMEDAESFIYIAVMNYLPTMEFSRPQRWNLMSPLFYFSFLIFHCNLLNLELFVFKRSLLLFVLFYIENCFDFLEKDNKKKFFILWELIYKWTKCFFSQIK